MKTNPTINSIFSMLLIGGAALIGPVESSAQSGKGPSVLSASPASGSKVESLSEIILTMDQPTADAVNEWGMENVELPAIFGAPSSVKATLWYPVGDMTKLRITIDPTITTEGTYEITIPQGYISNDDWESNPEAKLVYTIGSGVPGGVSVQYDVNYTSIEPGPGTYEALNTITLEFENEVFTEPEARAYLYYENMVYKGVRMAVRDGNKVDLLFEDFDTEGTYELVIEKAQIGDAEWLENHHLGHANPEFRIPGYRIKKTVSNLTYDFIPVLTPDGSEAIASLNRIELQFPGTWCSASEEPIAIYDYKDDFYPLSLSMGESLEEAVLQPESPITEAGQYRLVIPKGRFANSDYEETSGEEGALNPEITVTFDVSPQSNIAERQADEINVTLKDNLLKLDGHGRVEVFSPLGIRSSSMEVVGNAVISIEPGIHIVRTGMKTFKVNIK